MNVFPPTGVTGAGTQLPPAPGSALLVTAVPADHPARAGWVAGRVSEALPDGTLRLLTQSGTFTINAPPARLAVGTELQVRIDGRLAHWQAVRPAAAAGIAASAPMTEPRVSLPSSLFELAPVGPGTSAAQPVAAQSLGAVFPQAGNPAFSLIAALFPPILRDGTLDRLSARAYPALGAEARFARIARSAIGMTGEKPRNDPADLRWTLPFFVNGKLHHAHWQQRNGQDGPNDGQSHTFLEAEFALTGMVRILAQMDGQELLVHLISEKALPRELLRDLEGLLADSCEALGLQVTFSHAIAPRADTGV